MQLNGNNHSQISGNGAEPCIGVLALQGDFQAHCRALEQSGAQAVSIRTVQELQCLDGLVIPGGESTTMLKLLHFEKMFEPLREFGSARPIFGTCAGAILLASEVQNPQQESLGLMDITVERNGYGRQLDSRIANIEVAGQATEAIFIRAPIIRRTGPGVSILASYQRHPVLAQQGHHLVATFHPELSSGSAVHRQFVRMVQENMIRMDVNRSGRSQN